MKDPLRVLVLVQPLVFAMMKVVVFLYSKQKRCCFFLERKRKRNGASEVTAVFLGQLGNLNRVRQNSERNRFWLQYIELHTLSSFEMSLQFSEGEGREKLRPAQELTGSVQFTKLSKESSRVENSSFEI